MLIVTGSVRAAPMTRNTLGVMVAEKSRFCRFAGKEFNDAAHIGPEAHVPAYGLLRPGPGSPPWAEIEISAFLEIEKPAGVATRRSTPRLRWDRLRAVAHASVHCRHHLAGVAGGDTSDFVDLQANSRVGVITRARMWRLPPRSGDS